MRYITLFFLCAMTIQTAHAQVYVNHAATGANNGNSWTDAFTDLQPAINASSVGEEIWVAQGTYKPTVDLAGNVVANNRFHTFGITKDIKIYGGFDGSESLVYERDYRNNVTILDGDIGTLNNNADNSFHVVSIDGTIIAGDITNDCVLDGLTISNGNANGGFPWLYGGGIYNVGDGVGNQSSPTIVNCNIIDNYADFGGGFFSNSLNSGTSSPMFTNCNFTDNDAGHSGGGMYFGNSATTDLTIQDCFFTNNTALKVGGAIRAALGSTGIDFSIALSGVRFNNNHAEETGGALSASGLTNSSIYFCSFIGNTASLNGAALHNTDCALQLSNIDFSSNVAQGHGGAIYNTGSSPTIQNSVFGSNIATNSGGAIYNIDTSNVSVTNCYFTSNQAQNNSGGAIFNDRSDATLVDCKFTSNYATVSGGAILNQNSSNAILTECRFELNNSDKGGAVYNDMSSPTFSTCIFKSNDGYFRGGAMFNINSTLTFNSCNFSQNTSDEGGAIFNETSDPTLTNCVFTGNLAYTTAAGMFNVLASNAILTNCTFTGNISNGAGAAGLGAAIYNNNVSTSALTNCILWGNSTEIAILSGSSANFSNSIVYGGSLCTDCPNGDGNIDPQFVNGGDPDGPDNIPSNIDDGISLQSGSPAINAGKNIGAPIYDITGAPRLEIVDLGAYEALCQVAFVNLNASGTGTGESWENAFTDLQSALSSGCGKSIWVAQGTYQPSNTADRTASFELLDGVSIYGGFSGNGTETSLPERDIANNLTILSGDYSNDDLVDGSGATLSIANNGENAYHVIRSTIAISNSTVLDGFTITGGNANGTLDNRIGGGMLNKNGSSPTISNCIFTGNSGISGGGLNNNNSSPTIVDCVIEKNLATYGGGLFNDNSSLPSITNTNFQFNKSTLTGGGLYNKSFSSATVSNCLFLSNAATSGAGMYNYFHPSTVITDCTFDNNIASVSGGGIFNNLSSPSLTNCTFTSNEAMADGGGIGNDDSSPIITDCVFKLNSATNQGGAISNANASTPIISIGIFTSNSAEGGGAISSTSSSPIVTNSIFSSNVATIEGAAMNNFSSSPIITNCTFSRHVSPSGRTVFGDNNSNNTITNCILWGTVVQNEFGSTAIVSNSIVKGGYASCVNCPNIGGDVDPLFIDNMDLDGLDDVPNTADDGLSTLNGSPSIDQGTLMGAPIFDITGTPRYQSPDIGAYEGVCFDIIYVNLNATGNNTGQSWADAYTNLQAALLNVRPCIEAIWVAQGTYLPSSLADRDTSFALVNGISIYGGFSGNGTETMLGQRDIMNNTTILSGDYNNDDLVTGEGSTLSISNQSENAYNVIRNTNSQDTSAVLDGFIIKGGNAILGGGMYNNNSSPSISNCTFTSNSASEDGGGMYNFNFSSPTIYNCTFILNKGDYGGGLSNVDSSKPLLMDCTFKANKAIIGGGIYTNDSDVVMMGCILESNHALSGGGMYSELYDEANLTDCTFISNSATGSGGGLNIQGSYLISPLPFIMSNCIFNTNTAAYYGGGMYSTYSRIISTDCSFNSNTAVEGGGMYNYIHRMTDLTNCSFTANSAVDGAGIRNDRTWTGGFLGFPEEFNINNCSFTVNTASGKGGGIANDLARVDYNECTFTSNSANNGGAMVISFYGSDVVNCLFKENIAFINGGGIYSVGSGGTNFPIIRNCTFESNQAVAKGGGSYSSYLLAEDCTFASNSAETGGALHITNGTQVDLVKCNLINNSATYGGGIYFTTNSSSSVEKCFFNANTADYGGAFYNKESESTIVNSIFYRNEVTYHGGALYSEMSTMTVMNCSFMENEASLGRSLNSAQNSTISISNSILWGTEVQNYFSEPIELKNSIVKGGYFQCINCPLQGGSGNVDPLFVNGNDPIGPDNILGTADDGFYFQNGSPAINNGHDVGAPLDDITGALRYSGPDIGAYEITCSEPILYVNGSATGNFSGTTWLDAYNNIHDAILHGEACGSEVWVAQGTYLPSEIGDRSASFELKNGASLFGGFSGSGIETSVTERNPILNPTILSGDYSNDDVVTGEGATLIITNNDENAYNVILNKSGQDSTAILDGFVIKGGNANSTNTIKFHGQYGGGMHNWASSPSLRNCVFMNNSSATRGGGVFTLSSESSFLDCTFASNSAPHGGGMYSRSTSSLSLTDCEISSNFASISGGGLYISNSTPTLIGCTFTLNSAAYGGGLTNYYYSAAYLSNCTFTVPATDQAILNERFSTVTINGTLTIEKEE